MAVSSMRCRCGSVISFSAIPHPNGFKIVPEEAWDHVVHGSGPGGDDDAVTRAREISYWLGYECTACGWMWIFEPAAGDTPIAVWRREDLGEGA